MKRRSSIAIVAAALAIALLSISASSAHACSCDRSLTADQAAAATPVLFEGEVVASFQINDGDFGQRQLTTLRVVRPLKGVYTATVEIEHDVDSSACGFTFAGDLKGIVIGADREPNGKLTSNWCTMMLLNQVRQR